MKPDDALISKHVVEALQLLQRKEGKKLSILLQSLDPPLAAAVIRSVPRDVQPQLLKHVTGLDYLARLIAESPSELQQTAVALLDDARIAAIIRRMRAIRAADVIGCLASERRVRIYRRLGAHHVKELTSLLAYPTNTIGRLVESSIPCFAQTASVRDVLDASKNLNDSEAPRRNLSCYLLIDQNQSLKALLPLQKVISAAPETSLAALAAPATVFARPTEQQEAVLDRAQGQENSIIPVVSEEGMKLLGVVALDELVQSTRTRSRQALLELGGCGGPESMSMNIADSLNKRVPAQLAWGSAGLLTAAIFAYFHSSINEFIPLFFFIPALLAITRNAAFQAALISSQAVTCGELRRFRLHEHLKKEVILAALLGALPGVIISIVSLVAYQDLLLALTMLVSVSAAAAICSACAILLVWSLPKLGAKKAFVSAPLVGVITDAFTAALILAAAALLL